MSFWYDNNVGHGIPFNGFGVRLPCSLYSVTISLAFYILNRFQPIIFLICRIIWRNVVQNFAQIRKSSIVLKFDIEWHLERCKSSVKWIVCKQNADESVLELGVRWIFVVCSSEKIVRKIGLCFGMEWNVCWYTESIYLVFVDFIYCLRNNSRNKSTN